MPQNINLNVSPYYDDFDDDKNYHRVLFKPGKSIQARELTTLQSILQNQIEKFGKHFFKDGSMVIPGDISLDTNYTCVEIDSIHLGIPVIDYLDQLVGKEIEGEVSRVKAKIVNVINENISERGNNTLYVKYISSSQTDFTATVFEDGENLVLLEDVNYPLGVLRQNTTFANTIANNSNSIGSSVKITDGVYFIRGFFLKIKGQTLILDQYENTPSYRVGLSIKESFATASNQYNDLLDNSQGFYNFASSGADRLLIETELYKKELQDFDDENFVQLLRVENGELISVVNNTSYNILLKELARRTYDESGDYYINPFEIEIKESLNNYLGNNGIYNENDVTEAGDDPSDSLAHIIVSPGKAYVRGYEIEKISNTFLNLQKTRDTERAQNQAIPFDFGTQIEINNVYGTIPVGYTTSSYVRLYNHRTDSSVGSATSIGSQVGIARLYDLKLKSQEYIDSSSIFEVSLYDVQTYTKITINTGFSTSYSKSTYIEGVQSGANGFLVDDISTSTTSFNLYQVSGSFINDEKLLVNGVDSNRIVVNKRDYSLQDVYQITSNDVNPSTYAASFTADTVLSRRLNYSNEKANYVISSRTSGISTIGISTITTANDDFSRYIKNGDVIAYSKEGSDSIFYNKVDKIEDGKVIIKSLANVTNVNKGELPTSQITVNDIFKITNKIISKDSRLYSPLKNKFVESIDSNESSVTLRKTLDININNKSSYVVSAAPFNSSSNLILLPFDEELYTLTFNDGTVERLSNIKLLPNTPNQGDITLRNLSKIGNAKLTVTYEDVECTSRSKVYNRGTSLVINRTSDKNNTIDTDLTFSNVYGTRIEDKIISLNYPEVTSILAIYESSDDTTPVPPSLSASSVDEGSFNLLIKGEKIIGQNSKAVASVLGASNTSTISFCYLNNRTFEIGETIKFEESGVIATVGVVNLGSNNIKDSYILDSGIRDSYFDFSRIIRKNNVSSPTKKIRIYFNHYSINSNDSGSFVSVNSYDASLYPNLPKINKNRFSDILDFRPRVTPYNIASSISPFDFRSREFSDLNSSSNSIVAKNTNIVINYRYYLPRIDKLFLTKNGEFNLISGVPSIDPREPENLNESLEVARLHLPPYVVNVKDIKIKTRKNKRYTMKDISKLENKLNTFEKDTNLSLLELEAQNLDIIDRITNLNRYKTGFFVDNFTKENKGDVQNKLYRVYVDTENKELRPKISEAYVDLEVNAGLSTNIKVKENIVCLDYDNVEYLKNTFASNSVDVNINNSSWVGNIFLYPSNDMWELTDDPETGPLNVEDGETRERNTADDTSGTSSEETSAATTDEEEDDDTKHFIRRRNIKVIATALKPNTLFYPFFNNINVGSYLIPKLVEIEMISGVFSINELVRGTHLNKSNITFNLAHPRHKYGLITNPTKEYNTNPYSINSIIPNNYSTTSTILNIDIDSLASNTRRMYSGNISKGMILVGETSGAKAKVKDVRVITNESGEFIGSLFIPDESDETNPRFTSGKKSFVLTTNSRNNKSLTPYDSYAETIYRVFNNIEEIDENTSETQPIEPNSEDNESTEFRKLRVNPVYRTPLAQTFKVNDTTGIFLTKCDLYFRTKDIGNIPIKVEIRTVENGVPSKNVLKNSRVTLLPNDIQVSEDASIATTFEFPAPIYLEGDNEEYSLIISSNSNDYSIWISREGEYDISTLSTNQVRISRPFDGLLFKSQNASVWEPSRGDDLKFTLYRAEFTEETGSVYFISSSDSDDLNTNQVKKLSQNSIQAYSRSLYVNLNNNLTNGQVNSLNSGDLLTQSNNSVFNAKVTGVLGSLNTGYTLAITNPGFGYTDGVKNYTDVGLINLTGSGNNGRITLGVGTGVAYQATVTAGGNGYSIGDILTIENGDTENLGSNIILTVQNTTGIVTDYNSIIIDEVQGALSLSNDLIIGNTTLNGIQPDSFEEIENGLYLKINAKNHGMYSSGNSVVISSVQPDYMPTKLLSVVDLDSSTIQVEDANQFKLFEGRTVGGSTVGYLMIENEIIRYNGVTTTTTPHQISISGREIDNTKANEYTPNKDDESDTLVYKYEFNGISLRKINNTHSVSNSGKYKPEIDSFYIKVVNDSNKYFFKTKTASNVTTPLGIVNTPRTSYNVPFNSLKLITDIVTPGRSRVTAECKTYTSTSVNGVEVPYRDTGYQNCSLESYNVFDSMRAIYSKINEQNNTTSFILKLNLNRTENSKLSPVINLDTIGVIARSNRIDDPVSNWITDSRVNSLIDDPNSTIYVSKRFNLKNPADGLKVTFNAYRHNTNKIRVAYRLFRDDSPDSYQLYELFPGYSNIDSSGNVIDINKNEGLPDRMIPSSDNEQDYKEYEYTVEVPYTFTGAQVKIIMTGTNQAYIPKIKNLKIIATR
jgi:hypothetical protein